MAEKRGGPSFTAGRDQHIAYAQKGDATLHTSLTNAPGVDGSNLAADLAAIRELLSRLPVPGAVEAVKSAEQELISPQPNRTIVLNQLEQGLKIASTVEGFATLSDKLIPRLQAIAAWAGHNWESWRPIIGL